MDEELRIMLLSGERYHNVINIFQRRQKEEGKEESGEEAGEEEEQEEDGEE
jgi:hypothetical protein